MENIFSREEQIIIDAEELVKSNKIETENDIRNYIALLEEYKKLLKQFSLIVKVSDHNQLELNLLSKKYGIASNIDALTGLFNRRYFNETYQKEWLSAVRHKTQMTAIMIDIDFFKNYNDQYGHVQGDECLKMVAQAIQVSVLRARDIVARFGGEEFIVLLPNTDIEGGKSLIERVMNNIDKLNIGHLNSSVSDKITVSAGIASIVPKINDSSLEFINMSDKALYRAKLEGRNCYREYNKQGQIP